MLLISDSDKGDVVRVAPNELSFASVKSWTDIYGHQPAGKETLIKSEFYNMYGAGFKSLCVGSERNPQKHRKMKTSLSAAFSTKALHEQEHIVAKTVDSFLSAISSENSPSGLNMTKWYEMISFDILGEMAFGESFGCIESGWFIRKPTTGKHLTRNSVGKPHFWSEMIVGHLFFITVADNIRRLPLGPTFGRLVAPLTSSIKDRHTGYTRDKVSQ